MLGFKIVFDEIKTGFFVWFYKPMCNVQPKNLNHIHAATYYFPIGDLKMLPSLETHHIYGLHSYFPAILPLKGSKIAYVAGPLNIFFF